VLAIFPEPMVVLTVNGSNEKRMEAFKLYQKAFNAKKLSGEMPPDDVPPESLKPDELEIHIIMEINGTKFAIFPGDEKNGSSGNVSCQFQFENENDLRKAYEILAQGASEHFLDKPFWCKLFGLVTDKYNIRWALVSD
jgi:uncharacterized glyoxalase superfamily protein PhnB